MLPHHAYAARCYILRNLQAAATEDRWHLQRIRHHPNHYLHVSQFRGNSEVELVVGVAPTATDTREVRHVC